MQAFEIINLHDGFPSLSYEFDSRYPLQITGSNATP